LVKIIDDGQGFKEKDTQKYLKDFIAIDQINLENTQALD
jgi:hypothetical protein